LRGDGRGREKENGKASVSSVSLSPHRLVLPREAGEGKKKRRKKKRYRRANTKEKREKGKGMSGLRGSGLLLRRAPSALQKERGKEESRPVGSREGRGGGRERTRATSHPPFISPATREKKKKKGKRVLEGSEERGREKKKKGRGNRLVCQ